MAPVRRALVVACVLLAPAALAAAQPVQVQDAAGRPFLIDPRVPGLDVQPYADILSGAIHGDEIRDVTVRIVPAASVAAVCTDPQAVACYSRDGSGRGVISTPPGLDRRGVRNLLHEYGHHIDAAYANAGVRDPNGTPGWWRARRMGALLSAGRVSRSYAHGWNRALGEVFAEDYMVLNGGGRSAIGWLPQPSRRVRAAMRRDITAYPGPSPTWPAGDTDWRAFSAGLVGEGRAIALETPASGAPHTLVVRAVPDAARGITPLTVVVTCPGSPPVISGAPRGQGLTLTVGAPVGVACIAEARGDAAIPGGAALQVITRGPDARAPGS